MPPASSIRPDSPPAATSRTPPREIEHLFQVSLFLLIVVGFGALAATGKLDLLSLFIVVSALALRAVFLLRDRPVVIPRRATSYLAVGYLFIFVVDYFFFSARDFVSPAVHLVLFGICIKLFSIERERDYLYLALLAFLMVLSAAILTVDSAFLVTFSLFLILAVFWFMATELRRAATAASNTAPLIIPGLLKRSRAVSPLQRLSRSLIWTTLLMVVAIAAAATALFFAMPRVSGGYVSRQAQSDAISSGFSETVNLGAIGRIQQSSEVVAHLHIEGDTTGDRTPRLRGAVLSHFDGRRWSNPRRESNVVSQSYGHLFQINSPIAAAKRQGYRRASGPQANLIRYRILMEPLNTSVLFTIPVTQAIFGSFREIGVDSDQTLHNLDQGRGVSLYEGVSDVSVPLPTVLSRLPDATAPPAFQRYLQLPEELDPRISELAHSITANEPNPYLRALAIDHYLDSHYAYTLQLPPATPADPLADFLFHRRRGHCEYFASSMAVMLRTIGIPSRVITGFRGGQFNKINANYIIRASNAHSWVEAYIPGAGWTTFDPTPAGANAVPVDSWSHARLYVDAAREFWQEWVVNYDAGHQAALSLAAVRQTRSGASRFRLWAKQMYARLLGHARRLHLAASRHPRRLLRGGILLLAILAFAAMPFAAFRLRRVWRARSPRISPGSAASIVYLRMSRFLARRGYRRSPAQTPAEFAGSIDDDALRDAVVRFTAAYQHARFGGSPEQAVTLASLYEELRKTSSTS